MNIQIFACLSYPYQIKIVVCFCDALFVIRAYGCIKSVHIVHPRAVMFRQSTLASNITYAYNINIHAYIQQYIHTYNLHNNTIKFTITHNLHTIQFT